jgi:hypothetical protein
MLTALLCAVLLCTPARVLPGRPGGVPLVAARAAGDPDQDVVRDLSIDIEIDAEGRLHVRETYTWDFGDRDGLGLTRLLAQQLAWPADRTKMRVYEYADVTVTSPSGAPAEVWTVRDGRYLALAVGARDGSDDTRTGVQTYVLGYTVDGALNAIRDQPGVPDRDELYWNVTGHDWRNRIGQVTTTVRGPAPIVEAACYQGTVGSTDNCDTRGGDAGAITAGSADLAPGQGQTILAAFPAGTFADLAPILRDDVAAIERMERERSEAAQAAADAAQRDRIARWTTPMRDALVDNWWLSGGAALAMLVGLGWRRVRNGRDLHFVGLPPGMLPPEGIQAPVAPLAGEPVETVRFTPPEGLTAAEVGALMSEKVSDDLVPVILVDLAARGWLSISEAGTGWRGRPDDWLLSRTPENVGYDEELREHERILLADLFGEDQRVRLSSVIRFAPSLRRVKASLRAELDARGMFTHGIARSTSAVRVPRAVVAFLALVVVMVVVSENTPQLPGSLWALLLLGAGLGLAYALMVRLTAKAANGRSALGRALYDQVRGFRRYVATAEAEQVRFEEGIDVFSRYLPYAMVFGEAERWSEVFARLAAQGQVAQPSWYAGSHLFDGSGGSSFARSLGSFAATSSSALSATPGSSGFSGSSAGGGGFSGGGGGGGGGGGR